MIFATGEDEEKVKHLYITEEDEENAILIPYPWVAIGMAFRFIRNLFK